MQQSINIIIAFLAIGAFALPTPVNRRAVEQDSSYGGYTLERAEQDTSYGGAVGRSAKVEQDSSYGGYTLERAEQDTSYGGFVPSQGEVDNSYAGKIQEERSVQDSAYAGAAVAGQDSSY